jgi:hypothetical protein
MQTRSIARAATLALVLVVAALVAGCGSSNKSSSNSSNSTPSTSSTPAPSSTSTPSTNPAASNPTVKGAVAQCLQRAKAITDPSARKTAEEGCKAVQSGNPQGVKDAARKQCLQAAAQVPDPTARKQAETACKNGTK